MDNIGFKLPNIYIYIWFRKYINFPGVIITELEQLERLHSEDTPCRLMITHTIDSYWIPSRKKTKSKLYI